MFSLNKITDDVFTEKAEHDQSPLITLFYSLLDCSIPAKDFFIALNFHFPWIVEFPLSITDKIFTRLMTDSIACVDADEGVGNQRLAQARMKIDKDILLNRINNENTIAPSVKEKLLTTILTKHLIPHCTLSAAVVLPLYKKFSLSHKIIDPKLHHYFLSNLTSILSRSSEPALLNLYLNVINNAWLRELDTAVRHQLYALRSDLSEKFIAQSKQRLFYSTQASLLAAKIGVSEKQAFTPLSSGTAVVTKGDASSKEATTESSIYQGLCRHFGRP